MAKTAQKTKTKKNLGTTNKAVVMDHSKFDPTKVEMRPIHEIIPYPNNAKQHPSDQVAKIASSIAEFQFDQDIVVDGKGVIIKGHGRYMAALQLGLTHVPVKVRTDLTAARVKLARLADNRVAISEFDDEILKLELQDLDSLGEDLALTGSDQKELDELFDLTPMQDSVFDGDTDLKYQIVVTCRDEHQQSSLLARLESEGLKCQILIL